MQDDFGVKLLEMLQQPIFWVNLGGFLTAIITAIGGAIYTARKGDVRAKKIEEKVDLNTDVTIKTAQEQANKVDSAVKGSEDRVQSVANEAARRVAVVTQVAAEKVAVKAASTFEELSKQFEDLKVAINGRMDRKIALVEAEAYNRGLLQVSKLSEVVEKNTNRIHGLEQGHDDLKKGQEEIKQSIHNALNTIISKMSE